MHTTKGTAATYQWYVVYIIIDVSYLEEGGAEGRLGVSMDIKTGYNN